MSKKSGQRIGLPTVILFLLDKVSLNTSRLRGKGEREKGKKKPLTLTLYPKPDSELKMLNREVLKYL
ncbi:hypothetical protein IQ274_26850 [Nostoc sp. LEGE 12447]|uniref:hypothetical protein n=1 Tax=Nostoc sp. LEGE 12447 TaxID=1828640 RepID=UPI001883E881|nr:hypothetical protein [Nostoc sp. LEGE 12447]MBE9001730.1 hypothetical protein [Nostoc sp. LEGE 12447]